MAKLAKGPTDRDLKRESRRQKREQEKLARNLVHGTLQQRMKETTQEFQRFLKNPFVWTPPPPPTISKDHEEKLKKITEKGGRQAIENVTREVLAQIDRQSKKPYWGNDPDFNSWRNQLRLNALLDIQESHERSAQRWTRASRNEQGAPLIRQAPADPSPDSRHHPFASQEQLSRSFSPVSPLGDRNVSIASFNPPGSDSHSRPSAGKSAADVNDKVARYAALGQNRLPSRGRLRDQPRNSAEQTSPRNNSRSRDASPRQQSPSRRSR